MKKIKISDIIFYKIKEKMYAWITKQTLKCVYIKNATSINVKFFKKKIW